MASVRGADSIFDSAGIQLAPLGFGFNNDWETIERRVIDTAIATVDFTWEAGIYDEIMLTAYDVFPATDGAEARVTFSVDGGSTFLSSGYTYANDRWAGATVRNQSGSTSAAFIEFLRTAGNASGEGIGFRCELPNPDSANEKFCVITAESHSSGAPLEWEAMGTNTNTSVINGLRFLFDQSGADNTTGGVFILRGRRKIQTNIQSQDDWVVVDDQALLSAASEHDVFWDDQVYDEIEVSISGLVPGTDTADLHVLLSTDGSTFHTAASNYDWLRKAHDHDDTNVVVAGVQNTTEMILINNLGSTGDEFIDAKFHLPNVSNTTRKKTIRGDYEGLSASGLFFLGHNAGFFRANNNALRGIRFIMSTGTLSADRIRVRGRRLTPVGVLKQDWEEIERRSVTTSADEEFFWTQEWEEIEVTLQRITSTTDNIDMEFTLSTDGSTFHTGGTDYTVVRFNTNDDPLDASQDQGGARIPLIGLGDQANEAIAAVMHIFDAGTDGEVKPIILDQTGILANGSTTRDHYGAVMTVNTDAIRGINVGMGAGNTFSGEIVIRGRRKAT